MSEIPNDELEERCKKVSLTVKSMYFNVYRRYLKQPHSTLIYQRYIQSEVSKLCLGLAVPFSGQKVEEIAQFFIVRQTPPS